MKTTITIISVLSLIAAGIAVAAFTYQTPKTTEVIVLNDVTDNFLSRPDATQISGLYNLSGDNKWNGAQFLFSKVTDVSYNQTKEADIAAANQWLSNELERDKEVKAFQNGVTQILTDSTKEATGKPHSSIYLPMAHELISLSQSKAQKRVLLVYSDLMENDPGFSFYNKKELRLLQTNPGAVQKMFEQWQALPSLSGIEVHLIYQPANAVADGEFKTVSAFYQTLLQGKGATVYIQANLSQ